MSDRHKVRMNLTLRGQGSQVWLDDVEVKGLTDVKVEVGVDRATQVTFTMFPEDIQIEGEVGEVNVTSLQSRVDEWRMGGRHRRLVRWLARRSAVARYLIRRPGQPA